MTITEIVKAERSAADLASYFGTGDLHEKYEAAQAETNAAIEALLAENERLAKAFQEADRITTEAVDMLSTTQAERDAAQTKIEAVRKYADERAWYAAQNRTVGSVRIASDLFHILGLGPDGKERS